MSFNATFVADHIIRWLDSYSDNSGVEAYVVGVSGGIDSAVTAILCAQTGRPTFIVNMPIHQAVSEVERSSELIQKLCSTYKNISSIAVDLTGVYDALKRSLPAVEDKSNGLALANTRARLRMSTLYALGQERGALVVGTGNKIEDFGVGFFTKYGDGGVDISPIADLVKSEVFFLGAYLDVPQSILTAAPTDGLWGDDRNDEDQIGASYPELEKAMSFNGDPSTLADREKEVYEIYSRLNKINQHKMNPIPVCDIPSSLRKKG